MGVVRLYSADMHTRADAPLTKPAAALARLLSELGRRLLQRG